MSTLNSSTHHSSAGVSLTPALSRWEREDRSQTTGDPKAAVFRTASRKVDSDYLLSPLRGAMGHGESERWNCLQQK